MTHSYAAVCFDLFGTLVDPDGSPLEGASTALANVPRDRCAVVTSCDRAYALLLLQRAQLPVPAVLVTRDDVVRTKPSPECYAAACSRLNVAPAEALAVEDSFDGILAGRAAGVDVLAVLRGRPVRTAEAATWTVSRLADVTWTIEESGAIAMTIAP